MMKLRNCVLRHLGEEASGDYILTKGGIVGIHKHILEQYHSEHASVNWF